MPDYCARLIPDLEALHTLLALRKQHPGLYNDLLVRAASKFLNGYDMTASKEIAPHVTLPNRSRRGGGWNWVGVVSGLLNPNDSGVGALERRPRHDQGYHEGGGWIR